MFLLVSCRHVGAHLGGHQHGVSIQISINLKKTFLRISSIRKNAVTWILPRVFAYLPSFYFQILDLIYWTILIFYFDLFWMAWHWKPPIYFRNSCHHHHFRIYPLADWRRDHRYLNTRTGQCSLAQPFCSYSCWRSNYLSYSRTWPAQLRNLYGAGGKHIIMGTHWSSSNFQLYSWGGGRSGEGTLLRLHINAW